MLANKKILIGICGSIAAYKSALIIRLLKKRGAEVQVIMTPSASDFITPLTLSTLSGNPVYQLFKKTEGGTWNNHVAFAQWADLMVVAPASANTLAKFAHGNCDNLLAAIYFSAKCPVMIAPAMDLDMYQHPVTQENIEKVKHAGNHLIEVGYGPLASGLEGHGRMAEPENVVEKIDQFFNDEQQFKGKTFLITAGPTREAIDPVRYISNHSSGKMGYALAEEAAGRGAKVILVSGPTNCEAKHPHIKTIAINSAEEMKNAAVQSFPSSDVAILAAAVADYQPREHAREKIKKNDNNLQLSLTKTPDTAASLGAIKSEKQYIVGFALETENEEENARKKLHAKNMDMVVINSLQDQGAGFDYATNKIAIINRTDDQKIEFELKEKRLVAKDILNELAKNIHV